MVERIRPPPKLVERFFLGRTKPKHRQLVGSIRSKQFEPGSRRSKQTFFFGRVGRNKKSQTSNREIAPYLLSYNVAQLIWSHKIATYPFLVAMIATKLWVVQCRAKNSVAQSRVISVLGRAKSRNFLLSCKAQHTHFESQFSQYTK